MHIGVGHSPWLEPSIKIPTDSRAHPATHTNTLYIHTTHTLSGEEWLCWCGLKTVSECGHDGATNCHHATVQVIYAECSPSDASKQCNRTRHWQSDPGGPIHGAQPRKCCRKRLPELLEITCWRHPWWWSENPDLFNLSIFRGCACGGSPWLPRGPPVMFYPSFKTPGSLLTCWRLPETFQECLLLISQDWHRIVCLFVFVCLCSLLRFEVFASRIRVAHNTTMFLGRHRPTLMHIIHSFN